MLASERMAEPAPRVGIFGGSFDPPHVAHQLVCAYVLATARPRLERILMVPTWKHPFDKQMAPFADRVAMCELAAGLFPGRVEVSRIEEELGGESFTLRTVEALKARHPGVELVLIIGSDLVGERERWHRWPELARSVPFLVVGRVGAPGDTVAMPDVSSTDVRARIRRGDPVDALVAADVLDYIVARGLYGAQPRAAP